MSASEAEKNVCANSECTCELASDRPFGDYCGDYCRTAGNVTELRCECGHEGCQ